MSVYDDIENMSNRIANSHNARISARINLYSNGVKYKITEAEIAFNMLQELLLPRGAPFLKDESKFTIEQKMHFFVDSFFAFLYSAFDVISQVVNQHLQLGINENQVSFKSVEESLRANRNGDLIQIIYTQILAANYFKNLKNYRNCSTHRRHICIVTTGPKFSDGYSTTASRNLGLAVENILCDNPLVITPTINQNREILKYCNRAFEWAKDKLSKISTDL
jgi:hypothetical protein